ncbi:MAG: hypothetical protein L0Z50_33445, partial [Verrucomicrobiales bacterium]|nr:hypothetical protein [Verrucomicrobiales bacterium]
MSLLRSPLPFVFGLTLLLAAKSPLHAATITWTNVAGGAWSAAANWSPNQVPGPDDTAAITANATYTVTLDISPTVTSLTLGGASGQQTLSMNSQSLSVTGAGMIAVRGLFEVSGTLTCSAPLTVSGRVIWTGGKVTGPMNVANGGSLIIEGSNNHEFVGMLTNAGTVQWTAGHFLLEEGSTFLNQATGLFDVQSDARIIPSGAGPNRLINEGIFRKSAGDSGTSVEVDLDNRGKVELKSGQLHFPNGFASRGSFAVDEGTRLLLDNGAFTLEAGHTFTGGGFYGVESGNVTILGDLTATNLQLTGGTLNSTNRLIGTLRWTGGFLRGSYTVAAGGSLIIAGSNNHEFV